MFRAIPFLAIIVIAYNVIALLTGPALSAAVIAARAEKVSYRLHDGPPRLGAPFATCSAVASICTVFGSKR